MINIIKYNNNYIVSGYKDTNPDYDIIKVGFRNRVFRIFTTKEEAEAFLKKINQKGGYI
jgi:hypothetical protein